MGGGVYFQCAKNLGIVVKVFQFGVIGYDLFVRRSAKLAPLPVLGVGALLAGIRQLLNTTTFNAIGAVGVYYGKELGEEVPWCTKFPYNLGISDPQYWGVISFVWGMYFAVARDFNILDNHFMVPWMETFWYVCSMKLLESHANGGGLLKALGFDVKTD